MAQELDSFQQGKSRGKGKGKGKDKGKPKENVPTTPCPICGKAGHWKKDCWYNISGGWEETNKPKDKSKGKDGKDKTPANNQQQSNKDKKSAKCWNLQRYGTLFQRLSEQEAVLVGRGKSGATIILWTLSGFFLNAFEEEAELNNSFESKIVGVFVTGIDSGAARSVVPASVLRHRLPESVCSIRGNSRSWELWTAKSEA